MNSLTSLHQASITGNIDIVKLLIENGAKIDLKDKNGMRPIHYASLHGRLDTINLLIRCCSNCNEQAFNGDTPLHLAIQSGHADIVYQLIHYNADITLTNNQLKSSLDLACELGRTKIVEILLKSGLCVDYLKDKRKDLVEVNLSTTSLHQAARNGHNDIIRLLILYGFDINRFTPQGNSLHEACRYGRYQSVKILLECGIDMNLMNFYDQTPSDVIIKQKVGNDIKRLIKEYSEAVSAISIDSFLETYSGALNFQRDEFITVLERNPTGHWRGFILQNDYNARYGYFPSVCVRLITDQAASNNNSCMKALNALNSGKLSRFSSAITSKPDNNNKLEELTCNISPVGSIDSSSKLSLSNTADSGIGTTSQKSLTYSLSPPSSTSTSSRTNTIERQPQQQQMNLMLQSFSNQKQFNLPLLSPLKSPVVEDVTLIYGSLNSSPLESCEIINVSDLLRSGLNESQVIFNWLKEVNLEMYYENFVSSGYDLLTIMKMTPSDLCAIGISDPIHRKLIIKQMKYLSIKDLDEQLNQILNKTKNLKLLLELIHLDQYLNILQNQGYRTITDLYLINCEDLEEIGIRKLGHQKKLMLIIKRLLQSTQQPISYDLYATVRKPTAAANSSGLKKSFNNEQNARSMDNLSDDNYLLVKKPLNKPIPPKRTDSIMSNQLDNCQKLSNYATLPRKRNIIKPAATAASVEYDNRIEYLLPFANENVGTIKIKDSAAVAIEKQQQYIRNKVIIPSNCATNYVFNNNGQK